MMKNTNKHNTFEEQFKRKFEGAELSPPNFVWANIEKTLPKPIIAPFYTKNWFKAAATIVLILGLTTWFTYPKFSSKTQNISQKKEQTKQTKYFKTKEIQKNSLVNDLDNSEFQNNTTTNLALEKNKEKQTQVSDSQELINKEKHFTNLTTEKIKEENSQITNNQELIDKEKLIVENQKNKQQLTTTPLITNTTIENGTDEEKIKFLKTVYLALAKAKLDTSLPLDKLILQDFIGFPITKEEKILKEKRFLIGLKVSTGKLNLNYSGDNSQNAVGLEKPLSEYDTSTKAIDTNLFEQLRKAKGTRWSVGMDISYLLSKKWSINSGFGFNNNQYSVTSQVLHTKSEVIRDNITNILSDTLITETIPNSLTNKWQTLNIPLTMSYHIGTKKLTGSISFGIAANILLTQNQRAERLAYAYKLGNQKNSYFNSVIGFKLNYKLSPKWYWSAGVDYQNTLGSILNEDRVSLRPDTYQANTGFYFSF